MKQDIYIFGYGVYGEELALALKSHPKKSITIIDQYKRHISKAQLDGFDKHTLVDVHDDKSFEQFNFTANSVAFCTFEDEAYNTYLTITLRAIFKDLTIIAIGQSKESNHKLTMAGANRTIIVEQTGANILYNTLVNPIITEIFDELLYQDDGLTIAEITIEKGSIYDGVLLKDVDISQRYDLIVLGLVDQEVSTHFLFATSWHDYKVDYDDIVIVIGYQDEIQRFQKEIQNK